MATPDFILDLRKKIGNDPLWLIGVTAVVLRGEEVLLGRRADNGLLAPISGIVDPGEEPAAAAIREVQEETNVLAEAESLAWVHVTPSYTYANGDQVQYLDLVFRCRYLSGDPYPADGEASEVFWRRIDQLDDLESENHRERILRAVSEVGPARFQS